MLDLTGGVLFTFTAIEICFTFVASSTTNPVIFNTCPLVRFTVMLWCIKADLPVRSKKKLRAGLPLILIEIFALPNSRSSLKLNDILITSFMLGYVLLTSETIVGATVSAEVLMLIFHND